jgi:uncharacterized repeat protein (TIGR01451 family)
MANSKSNSAYLLRFFDALAVVGWLSILLFSPGMASAATISSFSPAFGSPGDPNYVYIYGSGFYPSTTVLVKYNGVTDTTATATAVNGTVIQSLVPAGATTGPISVKIDNGATAFSNQPFTVIGPGPFITGFSPSSGSPGSVVTISGVHFSSANDTATNVYFNGKAAESFFVQSDSSIEATAPAGVITGPISVRGTAGTNTTTTNFFAAPIISGFSPASGRTGTNVIVTGTNFIGASGITIGGIAASSYSVLSNNAISLTVPSSAVTGVIQVYAPASSYVTSSNFVVLPIIYGFSPGAGSAGTNVVITGANLAAITSVKFAGVAATFSGATFGQVSAVVPAGAVSGPISITTPDGSFQSVSNFYLPPSITGFSPNKGGIGTMVSITGSNLTNATSVSFNGTQAGSFFVTNNTSVGVIVPLGFSTGPITITTPGGSFTTAGLFYGVPGITSFNPTHGLPGTNVTIFGTNLSAITLVRFAGSNASFTLINNTTLSAVVPVGAVNGPITIGGPGGTNTSAQNFVLDYNSDLSVALAANPNPVFIGSNLVYNITVANHGEFPATNVRITNALPAGATLKASPSARDPA